MITICIPTIRPQNISVLIDTIHANAGTLNYEIDWTEDVDRIGCPRMLKELVNRSSGDLVCFIGDDTLPEPDFLKHALDAMATLPNGWGVVGLNSQASRHAGHFLADKRMLPFLGGEFFHTGYRHCWCDHELTDIANEMGRFVFADKSILAHNHPVYGTADVDDDYIRVYSEEYRKFDMKLYIKRKRERKHFTLGIGFPVIDKKVDVDFMVSFLAMNKPDYTLLVPKFTVGEFPKDIAAVRNNLVEQAQLDGCSHLLMLDTDQVYRDQNMIDKMLAHKSPVVGAPVHRRYPPFDAILLRGEIGKYKYISDTEVYSGDLIDIDATGTGCILFDMSLFDDLDEPYFEITMRNGRVVGEDIGICHKLRSRGIPIRADTSIEIGHITQFEVNRKTYEMFKALKGFQKAA